MSRLITAAAAVGLLLGIGLLLTGCGNTPAANKMGMESGNMSAMEGKMSGETMEGKMDGMMAGEKMADGKMMEGKMAGGKMDNK
jgi:hypothetical protein